MKNKGANRRNRIVFAALFAALIAVSNFIQFPTPIGVPIVLKNMFVVLSGTVLGGFYGCLAVLILTACGIIGIPVFVIPGGIGVFGTPLGGYILGYTVSSLCAGLISGIPQTAGKTFTLLPFIRLCIASFLGFAIILACGSFYIMVLMQMTLKAAFAAGTVPFVIGDLIKLAISVPLAHSLRPIAARYINGK